MARNGSDGHVLVAPLLRVASLGVAGDKVATDGLGMISVMQWLTLAVYSVLLEVHLEPAFRVCVVAIA